jgi:hypothetical protein
VLNRKTSKDIYDAMMAGITRSFDGKMDVRVLEINNKARGLFENFNLKGGNEQRHATLKQVIDVNDIEPRAYLELVLNHITKQPLTNLLPWSNFIKEKFKTFNS